MEKTVVFDPRDWGQWHGGIEQYGFWCVEVDADDALARFYKAQAFCEPLLKSGYARQPHITLAACGLVSPERFSSQHLQRQLEALALLSLKSFEVGLEGLDTFTSVPYLCVSDECGELDRVRKALIPGCYEQDHPCYQPHVTLGFYQQEESLSEVKRYLAGFAESAPIRFKVRALKYCEYLTSEHQERYRVRKEYSLGFD